MLTLFCLAYFDASGIRGGAHCAPLNIFGLGRVRVPFLFGNDLPRSDLPDSATPPSPSPHTKCPLSSPPDQIELIVLRSRPPHGSRPSSAERHDAHHLSSGVRRWVDDCGDDDDDGCGGGGCSFN